MQRSGSWNQFLKISNHIKTCSISFSGALSAPFSTLNFLRGCWRSTAAVAQGSVSAEAEGKCPRCSVTGKCSWQAPACSWHWGPCLDAGCLHKTRPCCHLYNMLPERTTILLQSSGLRNNCRLPTNPCYLFSAKKPVSQRDSEVQTLVLNKLQITPGVYLIPSPALSTGKRQELRNLRNLSKGKVIGSQKPQWV